MFKTNSKSDRVNYSDMLRVPDGYSLKYAVGTTYSLDLEALTAICIALGLSEDTDSELLNNPISMLHALQKVSEKLMIFCEAGQIKVPRDNSPLNLLLEKMVIPVALRKGKGMPVYPAFHPKTWIVAYEDTKGECLYRFIVMSRNISFDRSWDISFSMEGKKGGGDRKKTVPIMDFLDFLRDQVTSDIIDARAKRKSLNRVIEELSGVAFSTDSKEFGDNFRIMPLGIGEKEYPIYKDLLLYNENVNSKDYTFYELMVFSPFLSGNLLESWNDPKRNMKGTRRVLISRKSELAKVRKSQADNFEVFALRDEVIDGEEEILEDPSDAPKKQDIHAKMYLRRKYDDVDLYLGSMNATHYATTNNVEMMVCLSTRTKHLSLDKFLNELFNGPEDSQDNPFERVELSEETEKSDIGSETSPDQIIKQICRIKRQGEVISNGESYDVRIMFDGNIPEGNITLSPLRRNNEEVQLSDEVCFKNLDITQLSEFYVLTVTGDNESVSRIITIPTIGIPEDRDKAVINSVVKDKDAFISYVAFVLADDYVTSMLEERQVQSSGLLSHTKERQLPALYEKMLKTAAEDPEKLNEIGYLLDSIENTEVIPDEFRKLYETFSKTLKLKGR